MGIVMVRANDPSSVLSRTVTRIFQFVTLRPGGKRTSHTRLS